MLAVSGMNTYYGQAHILADVALEVHAGEVVVLLGRNGAGKSTTLKSIIGLVRPRSGAIQFRGQAIERIGCLPDRPTWFGLRPGRPPHLYRSDRPRESGGRSPARARRRAKLGFRANWCAVSESEGDARPPGRSDVRRRTTDADHCSHPGWQSFVHSAGRAIRRCRAGHCRSDGRSNSRIEERRRGNSACPSRIFISPPKWPIGPTLSRRAEFDTKAQ